MTGSTKRDVLTTRLQAGMYAKKTTGRGFDRAAELGVRPAWVDVYGMQIPYR